LRRFLPDAVLAILVVSTVAIAQQSVPPGNLENCVEVPEHDKVLCDRVDVTTTTEATTTTAQPTTTTEATTTTTAPTTTTSTTSTTTSTHVPGLVIPPTQPYPGGLDANGGYTIIASNAATGTVWWSADYLGTNLPYQPGSKWIDGDRQGYACGYGFIVAADGSIDGRFAFVRPPNQAYGKVNDRYMSEGQRYLGGSINTAGGQEIQDEDCTDVLSDIDYTNACRPVDERPRVAFFDVDGEVLDIRDYTNTDATNVVFNLHSVSENRVTVIACEDGLVGMIVYYDSMGDGQVAAELNE
jgi:hypothetical protein